MRIGKETSNAISEGSDCLGLCHDNDRLCGECERGEICPVLLEEIDAEFAARRIVNLMGAWCNQLIEVLGAMGIREARRLRGETGRAMFIEDLEADTFGRLFGKRKEQESVGQGSP